MDTQADAPRRAGWRSLPLGGVALAVIVVGTAIALVGPDFPTREVGWGHTRAAEAQMANFESAIGHYRKQNGKLPDALAALTETDARTPHPFMRAIPLDPWGTEYGYRRLDEATYRLRSNGEDGLPDTDDDVVWPREE